MTKNVRNKNDGNRINNSHDTTRQFTEATRETNFNMPDWVYDKDGYAHTIKNSLTRFIYSMDAIKDQGLPRGYVRRGATGVKYLVNCVDVDGKIEDIIKTWRSSLKHVSQLAEDSFNVIEELIKACLAKKYPLAYPQEAEAYDLGPFLTFAFAMSTVFNSSDADSDFVINDPVSQFCETLDVAKLDSELRSRLAAVIFFRLNGPEMVDRKDFNKADTIIIKTLVNDAFSVGHAWEQFWTLADKDGSSPRSLAEYRKLVMIQPDEIEGSTGGI